VVSERLEVTTFQVAPQIQATLDEMQLQCGIATSGEAGTPSQLDPSAHSWGKPFRFDLRTRFSHAPFADAQAT
jgi:hypothetical protein